MMVVGAVGCVTGVAGWAAALAQAPGWCRLPSLPRSWLSEGTGLQAPSIVVGKASATKRVVTFYLIFILEA